MDISILQHIYRRCYYYGIIEDCPVCGKYCRDDQTIFMCNDCWAIHGNEARKFISAIDLYYSYQILPNDETYRRVIMLGKLESR
jgi:hypothetical protein